MFSFPTNQQTNCPTLKTKKTANAVFLNILFRLIENACQTRREPLRTAELPKEGNEHVRNGEQRRTRAFAGSLYVKTLATELVILVNIFENR